MAVAQAHPWVLRPAQGTVSRGQGLGTVCRVTSDTFLRNEHLSRAFSLFCVCLLKGGGMERWGRVWGGLIHVYVVCMYVYAFLHVCVFLCVEARG